MSTATMVDERCGCPVRPAPEIRGDDADTLVEHRPDCPLPTAEAVPAPEPDPRAQYIAGLRALADLLESKSDLVLSSPGGDINLNVYPKTKEQLATWVRAMPGKKDKQVDDLYMRVTGQVCGLKIKLNAWRDDVCERVVVDTREVTELVPDPVKLAKVPMKKVTRTEEIVEWQCMPILDGAAVS